MSEGKRAEFRYLLSGTSAVLIVHFYGEMIQLTSAELTDCRSQIIHRPDIKFLMLNFTHLHNIGGDAIRMLAGIQKFVRGNGTAVRICGLNKPVYGKMARYGIIRNSEIRTSLREALSPMLSKS